MNRSLLIVGILFLYSSLSFGQSALWKGIPELSIASKGKRLIVPQKYQTFRLNKLQLQNLLAQVNQQGPSSVKQSAFLLDIPMPDGSTQSFRIAEALVMAPELAAKFPEIKTYVGQGIDNPHAHARLDWTPKGFHGMILAQSQTVYIDPHQNNDDEHYISYYKSDFRPTILPQDEVDCLPLDFDPEIEKEMRQILDQNLLAPSGDQLRTYRTAVAATGEYTQFHGGTVALGLAAIVTAINRVTGIYEVEIAVRLQLVANNDLLVYTNPSTDPYTNGNASALLGENQANCDAVIGNANYDIGHVFSTGGGGLAALGVVCNNNNKARGETGLGNPTGDPFYVDYVAHEIGHQFAGSHTFNGNAGSCSGNRSASSAYEPGSGSTIQAYAGICGAQNLQSNSDAYFHTRSFDQMVAYTTNSTGNNCPQTTSTNNNVPIPNAGAGGFVIPISTPFALTGSATDADNDPLTYCWEEFDLGPAGAPDAPSGNAPIFRSWPATDNPTRTFPRLTDLVNNTTTIGEILPSYGRGLTFRMTVRDNRADGGGVDYDQISMTVAGNAGPFLVTYPNTALNWTGGSTETITWDVANTTAAPVSCANVDILLSTDGGFTFPTTILSNVPNDGSQDIVVPNVATTSARIKIACSNNVFFDLSNQDITIVLGGDDFTVTADPLIQESCLGANVVYIITVGQIGNFTDPVTLSAPGAPGTVSFMPNGNNVPYNSVLSLTNVPLGNYTFDIMGTDGTTTKMTTVDLNLLPGAPATVVLGQPLDGAANVALVPAFRWNPVADADSYLIQIATDVNFTNIVDQANVAGDTYNGASLLGNTNYFWRVRADNICGQSNFPSPFSFSTANILCLTINSTDVPKSISSSGTPSVSSVLNFPDAGIINDINVLNLIGTHSYIGDLDFNLISPAGSSIQIMERTCGSDNNFDINLDDAGAGPAPAWPCPPTDGGTYAPSNPLSVFDGQDPQGTWTLRIDDNANLDGGSLNSWSLEVCYEPLGGVPVELVQLQAKVKEENIYLDWSTASEINNKGFDLERSTNPQDGFDKIAWIPGKIQSTTSQYYQYLDQQALPGLTYYYRLRQVDLDEKSQYSPIVSATIPSDNQWQMSLYPNPAKDQVEVLTISEAGDQMEISLYNVNGQLMYHQALEAVTTATKWPIDLSRMASGVYLVKAKNGDREIVKRLIVK